MLGLARWGSRAAVVALATLFVRHLVTTDGQIEGRWIPLLLIALVLSVIVAVVTLEPVLKFLRRGPKLVAGDFTEDTRSASGGPDLQVMGVRIYNELESGDESKIARGVVPTLEAFDLNGHRVAKTEGVWFPDRSGAVPSTVDFRPTQEAHPLELAGKFPDGDDAWLAGEADPPSLAPGDYEIRVTLRGGNLKKPARLKFFVRNPGAGGRLSVSTERAGLAVVVTSGETEASQAEAEESQAEMVRRKQAALKANAPKIDLKPKPPAGTALDTSVSKRPSGTSTLTVKNVGDVPVERIEWIFPEDVTNWQVFQDSLASYPIPVLEPGDEQTALLAVTMGGPAAIEITLRGWVGEAEYTRKRTLSVIG